MTRKFKKSIIFAAVLTLIVALLTSCSSTKGVTGKSESSVKPQLTGTVKIGIQSGFGYASLLLMKELDLIGKRAPGVKVEFVSMSGGTPLTELLVKGDIDIAQIGTAPFLTAWDKGIPVKLIGTSMIFPMELVTWKPEIKSLKDFSSKDRIALPGGKSSQQYLMLSLALEKQLGDPKKLDMNLVNMDHPDAFAALQSKSEIVAHYATPPTLYEELALGYHSITTAKEAFGQHNYSSLTVRIEYYEKNKKIIDAFNEALAESQSILRDNPQKAAQILAPIFKFDEARTLKYLTWEGTEYSSKLSRTLELADLMYKRGLLSKIPKSISDVAFEGVSGN